MNLPRGNSARLAALSMLESVLDKGLNLGDADSGMNLADSRDRAFARFLTYGILRWLTALDWLARQLLKKPLKQRDRDIHRLILLGIFELWKGSSAPHAATSETAEGARKLGKPWAVGVINAVLRRFQREQVDWLEKLDRQDERHAHPKWLLQALRDDWPDDWPEITTANNRAAPLWLRLNSMFPSAETIGRLESGGFSVTHHPLASDAIKVNPAAPVDALPGFQEGLFSVQDPAAQLTAGLLDLDDEQRILDACAAPGGKTCHILEKIPGADLTVLDQSSERLGLIRENMERLCFAVHDRIQLIAADASEPGAWWDGNPYHRILVDAPCTATGVIRRHPEIRHLRRPEQVREAVRLQARLLEQLWPLLDTGGILLYATCSVLKDENSRQIRHFVERQPDAKPIEMGSGWGREQEFGRQILPGEQEMDGFYYAGMRKLP